MVTFAALLADETRQEIMKQLCCQWLNVSDVVSALNGRINQPTVSHHLKKLEEHGLVQVRREGRQRFYTLNQAEITACCGNLLASFAPDMASDFILSADVGMMGDEPA